MYENEKKDNKQCLSDTPRWSMKKINIKNTKAIQKWLSLKSSSIFFDMTLLHAHAQYIFIVNAK